ncbi:MAG: acetyltransferase [Cyanomargarita calcarea GSE-NOS-MK-12-04C]|jgi:hypothetical protein|uniref:Acetyltransferase n=1 Tax=Cyanomargarita calcarea GSE-NOS-MK-12-04C TaxID=2839659 RepID=A0A951QP58_9CYAN|nr:acetyltransferase [Cyanomargarita calcarea GSE-NOS-MK-12-04C]
MFLQLKDTGDLVEILEVKELIDPNNDIVRAQSQVGEEEQDPASYHKGNLVFPSGETLPRCWVDADYKAKAA